MSYRKALKINHRGAIVTIALLLAGGLSACAGIPLTAPVPASSPTPVSIPSPVVSGKVTFAPVENYTTVAERGKQRL